MIELFRPLSIAALLGAVCTIFHIAGMLGIMQLIRRRHYSDFTNSAGWLSFSGHSFTITLFLSLFVMHGIEVLVFAAAYLWIGALPDVETALYYSTISYSTVGYDNANILKEWRMVGAVESMVGIMLIGWSTAFSVRLFARLES